MIRRISLLTLLLLTLTTTAWGQGQTIDESSQGRVWWTTINEFIMDSKIADAAKFRVGAPFEAGESGGGGAFSFDVLNFGGNSSRRIEVVLFTGGMNSQGGGESGLFVTRRGTWGDITDAAQVRIYEATSDGIVFHVPVTFAGGGGGVSGITDTMWAPDGLSFTQQQTDANFVTYTTKVPYCKDAACGVRAVWSRNSGPLDAFGAAMRTVAVAPWQGIQWLGRAVWP